MREVKHSFHNSKHGWRIEQGHLHFHHRHMPRKGRRARHHQTPRSLSKRPESTYVKGEFTWRVQPPESICSCNNPLLSLPVTPVKIVLQPRLARICKVAYE
jgi:hypothetical protein